jgi:hypothetical protein
VAEGRFDRKAAARIAREIFFETPQELLGMDPVISQVTSTHDGGESGTRRAGPREAVPASGVHKAKPKARTARGG